MQTDRESKQPGRENFISLNKVPLLRFLLEKGAL